MTRPQIYDLSNSPIKAFQEDKMQQEVTRVAFLHPITGKEVSMADSIRADSSDEETTIACITPPRNHTIFHTTEEFVPRQHALPTGEQTCLWKESPNRFSKAARILRNHPRCTGALAFILVVLITGTTIFLRSTEQTTEMHSAKKPKLLLSSTNAPLQTPPFPVDEVTLFQAIQYVREGNMEQAANAYRILSEQHPDNKSFKLSVEILTPQEQKQ